MSAEPETITISILSRDYQISCPAEEEEALRKSARFLDQQMDKVKARGTTLGFEKVAIMAALNICHELLQTSNQANVSESDSVREIRHLEDKIESALQASRQIEI